MRNRLLLALIILIACCFVPAPPAEAQLYGVTAQSSCANVGNWTAQQFCFDQTIGALYSYSSSGTLTLMAAPRPALNQRFRLTATQINGGYTILPAISGVKYRLIDAWAVAYGGGNCSGTTDVDITGVQSTSTVKLVAFTQASLTQSTIVRAGATGGTVLADGASFAQNDANSIIAIANTGSALATCTGIDFNVTYVIEK